MIPVIEKSFFFFKLNELFYFSSIEISEWVYLLVIIIIIPSYINQGEANNVIQGARCTLRLPSSLHTSSQGLRCTLEKLAMIPVIAKCFFLNFELFFFHFSLIEISEWVYLVVIIIMPPYIDQGEAINLFKGTHVYFRQTCDDPCDRQQKVPFFKLNELFFNSS